jgi:hypothetical protein
LLVRQVRVTLQGNRYCDTRGRRTLHSLWHCPTTITPGLKPPRSTSSLELVVRFSSSDSGCTSVDLFPVHLGTTLTPFRTWQCHTLPPVAFKKGLGAGPLPGYSTSCKSLSPQETVWCRFNHRLLYDVLVYRRPDRLLDLGHGVIVLNFPILA